LVAGKICAGSISEGIADTNQIGGNSETVVETDIDYTVGEISDFVAAYFYVIARNSIKFESVFVVPVLIGWYSTDDNASTIGNVFLPHKIFVIFNSRENSTAVGIT
jgi:hypothetical protein